MSCGEIYKELWIVFSLFSYLAPRIFSNSFCLSSLSSLFFNFAKSRNSPHIFLIKLTWFVDFLSKTTENCWSELSDLARENQLFSFPPGSAPLLASDLSVEGEVRWQYDDKVPNRVEFFFSLGDTVWLLCRGPDKHLSSRALFFSVWFVFDIFRENNLFFITRQTIKMITAAAPKNVRVTSVKFMMSLVSTYQQAGEENCLQLLLTAVRTTLINIGLRTDQRGRYVSQWLIYNYWYSPCWMSCPPVNDQCKGCWFLAGTPFYPHSVRSGCKKNIPSY